MVNVLAGPVQPLKDGVTVMVAVTGAEVLLIPVNEEISPVPLAANPIAGLLLVQLYIVPLTVPVKCIAEVALPLQRSWSLGCTTSGATPIVIECVAVS